MMLKQLVSCTRYLVMLLFAFGIWGCGDGPGDVGPESTLVASESCIRCHKGVRSVVTGADIAMEWLGSAHNSEAVGNDSGLGASCGSCHKPDPRHPVSCSQCHGGGSGELLGKRHDVDADLGSACYECHGSNGIKPLGRAHFPLITPAIAAKPPGAALWNNMTTVAYVSSQTANRCWTCHNPHDNRLVPQFAEWAQSGHGDVRAAHFASYDFKTRGTTGVFPATAVATECVRCHTATGYINYVSSGFADIHAWGISADVTKQAIYCNACHDDGAANTYAYRRRAVPAVIGYYNFSSSSNNPPQTILGITVSYPDIATSNICLPCHIGRQIGRTIKQVEAAGGDFSNMRLINPHYLGAGATVFNANGFEFYSSNLGRYENISFRHGRIGVMNENNTGYDGPCVTCHMKPGRHTFEAVKLGVAAKVQDRPILAITSTICSSCHTGVGAWTPAALDELKQGYADALAALAAELTANGIANPGSYTAWGDAGRMGAAFNYNILYYDHGAYVHNSRYTKRLIYDSIDYLDDGAMNQSVAIRLVTPPHVGQPYQLGAAGYLLQSGGRP